MHYHGPPCPQITAPAAPRPEPRQPPKDTRVDGERPLRAAPSTQGPATGRSVVCARGPGRPQGQGALCGLRLGLGAACLVCDTPAAHPASSSPNPSTPRSPAALREAPRQATRTPIRWCRPPRAPRLAESCSARRGWPAGAPPSSPCCVLPCKIICKPRVPPRLLTQGRRPLRAGPAGCWPRPSPRVSDRREPLPSPSGRRAVDSPAPPGPWASWPKTSRARSRRGG